MKIEGRIKIDENLINEIEEIKQRIIDEKDKFVKKK